MNDDDDFDIDNPPPLYPITWEQVKPYAIDWLLPDENLFEKENLPVLRFAQGLLADFASPDAQAIRDQALEDAVDVVAGYWANTEESDLDIVQLVTDIRSRKSQAPQPAQEGIGGQWVSDKEYWCDPHPSQVKEPPASLTSGEGEVRFTPKQCAAQFRLYAEGNQNNDAKRQLNLCADFLDEYCAAPTQPAAEADERELPPLPEATQWVDEEGRLSSSNRKAIFGLHGDGDGSYQVTAHAKTLDEAVRLWRELISKEPNRTLDLTGWNCGVLASHYDMQKRYGQSQGTFHCPICHKDTPHTHTPDEVAEHQAVEENIRSHHEKRWDEISARIESLEKHYPFRTPAYTADQMRTYAKAAIAQAPARQPDIKAMVDRFLGWKLPDDFAPDCGISFTPLVHPNGWPIGTNLLTADQAKAMFEYCLAAPQQGATK